MDAAPFRSPHAPLPAVLNVSLKSVDRWRVAHGVAQRLAELPYDYALTKLAKYTPEMARMVRLRLDAFTGRRADWLATS
jgi:hypothetical protein